MNSKSIFLCGFMGCGKSYIGKQVADSLSLPFFDLDLLIETTADSTIADIFKNRGENYFRSLEAQCLHHIAGIPRSVVALGGGTILREENLRFVKEHGTLVFLDIDFATCYSRICDDPGRPLAYQTPLEELHKLFDRRHLIYYKNADVRVTDPEKFLASLTDWL